MHNVEEPWDYGNYVDQRKRSADIHLGDAIEKHHRGRDHRRPNAGAHGYISRKAAEQASHTVGYFSSCPTAVEYFQQRSHFVPSARSTLTRKSPPDSSTTCDTMNSAGRSD